MQSSVKVLLWESVGNCPDTTTARGPDLQQRDLQEQEHHTPVLELSQAACRHHIQGSGCLSPSGAGRWCHLPTEHSALLTLDMGVFITGMKKQMPFLALERLFLLCH